MGKVTIEIIPDPDYGGFTARIPDIPAYGEGQTEEAAIADLKAALAAYVEEFGLDAALSRVNAPTKLRELSVDLRSFVRALRDIELSPEEFTELWQSQ